MDFWDRFINLFAKKDPAKINPDNFSNFVRQSKKYDAFFPFSQDPNYKQREKTK